MKVKIAYKGFKDGEETYLTFNGEYAEHDHGNLIALKFPSGTKIIPATALISIWIPIQEEPETDDSIPPPPIA